MIDLAYVQRMARYNRWQNQSLYGAADALADDERRRERGAFFGSIHKTLSHLLWADRIWMSRFTPDVAAPAGGIPGSVAAYPEWEVLKRERSAFDATVIGWADALDPHWLASDLTWYSGAAKRELTQPKWQLVMHMFNHQTHHRGQVHCMLTQAGGKPADTDLILLPE
jgi:uncharacterized damage-inducible protein DinB